MLFKKHNIKSLLRKKGPLFIGTYNPPLPFHYPGRDSCFSLGHHSAQVRFPLLMFQASNLRWRGFSYRLWPALERVSVPESFLKSPSIAPGCASFPVSCACRESMKTNLPRSQPWIVKKVFFSRGREVDALCGLIRERATELLKQQILLDWQLLYKANHVNDCWQKRIWI